MARQAGLHPLRRGGRRGEPRREWPPCGRAPGRLHRLHLRADALPAFRRDELDLGDRQQLAADGRTAHRGRPQRLRRPLPRRRADRHRAVGHPRLRRRHPPRAESGLLGTGRSGCGHPYRRAARPQPAGEPRGHHAAPRYDLLPGLALPRAGLGHRHGDDPDRTGVPNAVERRGKPLPL